jgi:hypothetical protein
VGPFSTYFPLPAKITVEVLPPLHLREEFGSEPDLDEAYEAVVGQMQDTLDRMSRERRLPVVG